MRTNLILSLLLLAATACQTQLVCPVGRTACGDRCVDLLADPSSCGACGQTVGPLQLCSAGAAACRPGIATCGGACTDLARDPAHCGTCGTGCGGGTPYCTSSGGSTSCTASCPTGYTACGQACVDLQADQMDCGACGHACAVGQSCRAGACRADLAVACYSTDEVVPVAADLSPGGPSWPVPAGPSALAMLGGAVYSANGYPQASVSTLPLDPSYAGTSVQLTGNDLEDVTSFGGVLLVTNAATGTLVILSAAGDVLGEIPMPDQQSGPNPHGVDALGNTAWVALYGSASSGQAIAQVDLSGLSACASGSGACGSVVASVDLRALPGTSNAPGLPFPSDVLAYGNAVFVTLANLTLGDNAWDSAYYVKPAGSGKLVMILSNAGTPTVIDLGPSCGNPGALAADGTTLWVACGSYSYPGVAPPVVVPLDLTNTPPTVGAALPLPGMVPGKLAFCGGVGYVTDQASGAVVRFDPAARSVEPPVAVCPTSAGPYGYAWAADITCSN